MNQKLLKTGPSGPGDAAGERDVLDGPLHDDTPHPALDHAVEEHQANAPQKLDTIVFGVTAVIAIGFVLWGFLSTESLGSASSSGLGWVVHNMGWLFSLVASGFVLFVIWLAASKYGRIPLGRDDEEPEFKTVSWIAMMFSAGMG
ncbi:MAG: BCCT family transporter, partial [Knoellia sp.]